MVGATSVKILANPIGWFLCQPTLRCKMLQRGYWTVLAKEFPEEMKAESILLGWFDSRTPPEFILLHLII